MFLPNLKSIVSPVLEIIVIGVLGGVANSKSWVREGHRGSGMVLFKRALVSSYMRFRDITAFML